MPIVSRNSSTESPFSTCTFLKNCSASIGVCCGGACRAVNTLPSRHIPQTVARYVNTRDVDVMPATGSDGTLRARNVIRADDLSVGERDRTDASDGRPALDWFERHRDLIARLEQQPAPASLHEIGGVGGLDDPVDGLAIFRDVELEPAMRVGPDPFGDRAFEVARLAHVKGGIAMMGKHRSRNQSCEQGPSEKGLHASISLSEYDSGSNHYLIMPLAGSAKSLWYDSMSVGTQSISMMS